MVDTNDIRCVVEEMSYERQSGMIDPEEWQEQKEARMRQPYLSNIKEVRRAGDRSKGPQIHSVIYRNPQILVHLWKMKYEIYVLK